MSDQPRPPKLDLLKTPRRAVAAIVFLGKRELPDDTIRAEAEIVDEAIIAQFPESDESKRPGLMAGLSQQLGDAHYHRATSRLRSFYAVRRATGNSGDDGSEEPVMERRYDNENKEL